MRTTMSDHAKRTAVLSGLDELARGLDYGQARTIRDYILAAEARVKELEADVRMAMQAHADEEARATELREAAVALYERVQMDESVGICLSERTTTLALGAALAKEDTA